LIVVISGVLVINCTLPERGRLLSHQARRAMPQNCPEYCLGVLPMSHLTPKELEVTQLIGSGASNREIAQPLFISESTVKTHVNSIFNRLGLKNRSPLAIYANRHLLDCG
jgi:DNA-binding NarL/FixJ family response regulator